MLLLYLPNIFSTFPKIKYDLHIDNLRLFSKFAMFAFLMNVDFHQPFKNPIIVLKLSGPSSGDNLAVWWLLTYGVETFSQWDIVSQFNHVQNSSLLAPLHSLQKYVFKINRKSRNSVRKTLLNLLGDSQCFCCGTGKAIFLKLNVIWSLFYTLKLARLNAPYIFVVFFTFIHEIRLSCKYLGAGKSKLKNDLYVNGYEEYKHSFDSVLLCILFGNLNSWRR